MKLILWSIAILFLAPASAQVKVVREAKFVAIGGIDQWVTIRGNDSSKPVVLFLHGGPGSVMSPYDAIYSKWEDEFVLVNWDQRGAGRTFGRNAPAEVNEDYWVENPLTVEQMVADGIALSEYLVKHLHKKKIILMATSWGSVLGVRMAVDRPDLFYAYIGHAQVINPTEQLAAAYGRISSMAADSKDGASLEVIMSNGAPPYENAKMYGQLFRVIKKYERENSTPAPDAWWKVAAGYDNEADGAHRVQGDDYSFIHYVGHRPLGIKPMMRDIDFERNGLHFTIPVYLLQGKHDILTSPESTNAYFRKIKAPRKKYFLFPDAAHGHNESVVDMQYNILREHVSPLATE